MHRRACCPTDVARVSCAPVTLQRVATVARQGVGCAAFRRAAGRTQAAGTALLIASLAAWAEPAPTTAFQKR